MRIFMIGQKGLPAHSGGVERHVDELSRRLVANGHEVFVYARKSYCMNSNAVREYFGVKLIYLPSIRSKHWETVVHTFLASLHVLCMRPDIIHYHGIGPALFSLIPRLCVPWKKTIVTFHCQDYFHQKWGRFAQLVFRIGEFIACTLAHRTIVVSRTLQQYVKEVYDRDAVYIPNAVSIPERRVPNIIASYGLKKGNYLLSVSRLVRHKGVHHIIEAYNRFSFGRKHVPKLVIVGDSVWTAGYVAFLKEIAAGNPLILFLGEQSGRALEELYSNALLFIQASENEGLSYALLEAMSYGCPVLVSDIAENKEVLPSIGYTFETGNVKDLEYQIYSILHSPRQAGVSGNLNYDYVKKWYNIESIIEDIVDVYNREQPSLKEKTA